MGVAVKVTELPAHTGFWVVAIVTDTGSFVFSTIVMELDVAGFPDGHATLDVKRQETISPLEGIYVIAGEL